MKTLDLGKAGTVHCWYVVRGLETPPTGWLNVTEQHFLLKCIPNLAISTIPKTNKLPDLRGEFIRGETK